MKAYLQAFDLWEVVENNLDPSSLSTNPTLGQIKHNNEKKAKKFKAKISIF
jgi:hypothetical protein